MPDLKDLLSSVENCDGVELLHLINHFFPRATAPALALAPAPAPFIRHLVLQGGGAKGAAYPGLIKALEEERILPGIKTFVGSSAGAISAFLLALGFNAKEFEAILDKHNLLDLMDRMDVSDSSFSETPAKVVSFFNQGYAYSGANALNFFEMLCEEILGDANATFKDLEEAKKTNPRLKSLVVTATLLNKGRIVANEEGGAVYFSSSENENARIADAIRASMSIPGVFSNHPIRDKIGTIIGYYTDGGVLNNYPIQHMREERYLDPNYPLSKGNDSALGATLVSRLNPHITGVPVPKELVYAVNLPSSEIKPKNPDLKNSNSIAGTVTLGVQKAVNVAGSRPHEDIKKKTKDFNTRTVEICNAGVDATEFGTKKKAVLRDNGYIAARAFIHTYLNPENDYEHRRFKLSHDSVVNRRPETIASLVGEFLEELNKYEGNPLSTMYTPEKIVDNVRLRYLANEFHHTMHPTPDELTTALTLQKDEKANQFSLINNEAIQLKYLVCIDDDTILNTLHAKLHDDVDEKFKRYLDAQLSQGLQLVTKIHVHNKLNLLQAAVWLKLPTKVTVILDYLRNTCTHIAQQGREYKPEYLGFINDCEPSLLELAITNQDSEMIALLLEKGADPLLSDQNGRSPFHIGLDQQDVGFRANILSQMITSLQKQERLKELSTTQFGPDGNTIWHELLLNICDEDTVDIFHERLLEASTGNLVAMQLVVMRTENAAGISLYECFYTKKLFPWIEKDYWVSSEPFKAVQSEECQTSIQQKKSTYEAKVLKVQKLYDSLVRNEKIVTDTLNQTSTEDLKELLTCPRQENKLLHLAIKKEGDLDVVTRICLLVGQDVKKYLDKKHNGKSALYLAAELGKGEIAKLLRKKYDAAVEKTGPKECPSAMLVAAKNGFYELVTILIDSKPRVSAFAETITRTTRDDKGLTPIHYVAMGGSAKQIQHLLITNKNANPLAENYGKLKDGEDFTALDRIVRRKDAETLLNDLSGLFNFESVENKKSNLFDLFNVDTPGGRQCLSPFAYALLFNYPVAEFINKCRDKPLTDGALNEKRGSLQDYRRNVVEELSGVVAFDETGDEGFDSPPPIFGSPPSSDDDLPQPVSDDVRGSEFNPPLSAQVDLDGAQTLTVPTSEPSHIERNDDVDNQPDPPATATDADRQALFAKIAVDSGIPNPGGRFADRFVTAIKALWRGLIDAVKYVARSFGIIS